MKKKKGGIVGGFAVLGLIVLVSFLFISDRTPVITTGLSGQFSQEQSEDVTFTLELSSIIETEVVFTESDDDAFIQFLDEIDGTNVDDDDPFQDISEDNPPEPLPDLPPITEPTPTEGSLLEFGSTKLIIETSAVLLDSDGNPFPQSSFLGIPQLTVIDEQGNIIDLGLAQVGFFARFTEPQINSNIFGTVQFYLDTDLIQEKQFFSKSTTETDLVPLGLTSRIDPFAFNQSTDPAFTFSFLGEGERRNWLNNSEHYLRAVIKEISANANNNQDAKEFKFLGDFVAYQLKVVFDEQKIVYLDDDGNAIEIFKSDSKVQQCASGQKLTTIVDQMVVVKTKRSPIPVTPSIKFFVNEIEKATFQKISGGTAPEVPASEIKKYQSIGKHTFGLDKCNIFSTIERNADLKIIVDEITRCFGSDCITQEGQQFIMKTPTSQHNYNLECHAELDHPQDEHDWKIICKSNFGYETETPHKFVGGTS